VSQYLGVHLLNRADHPVWQVYDEFRSSRLTAYCLRESIARWKFINGCFESVVAVGSATSVAGLSFLKTGAGADIWTVIGALAILLKVTKPVFGFRARIERTQKLASQFEDKADELNALKLRIQTQQDYDETCQREFLLLISRWNGKIHDKEGDLHAAVAFKSKCQKRVEAEFPGKLFYVPPEYEKPKRQLKKQQPSNAE
jgi:hypothetical protein